MSTYNLEEKQNLNKIFRSEQVQGQAERATQSRIKAAHVRLIPLSPSWYDGTVSLDGNVLSSSSGESEYDLDFAASRKTVIVPALEEFPHPQTTRKTAHPPYARHRSTLATLTRQYLILLRVLLTEYRTAWFLQVFGGLLIPISFAFVIVAVGGATSPEKAIYLLGGNMALSIATGPATFLILKIGWAQRSKEFHYWIALPIPKLLLVLALVSIAQLFALPGQLGVYVFGNLLFGLPFSGAAWALVPLIPLGVLPLTGVGALLGLFARSGETASILSNCLIILVGVLSPVMLPLEALPVPLRILSQFMPTTYVADAFRAVLGGQGTNLAFDLIILALFSAVLLTITYFRLDWRNA
jgi:ABC-2 type transport system permease protein